MRNFVINVQAIFFYKKKKKIVFTYTEKKLQKLKIFEYISCSKNSNYFNNYITTKECLFKYSVKMSSLSNCFSFVKNKNFIFINTFYQYINNIYFSKC